jgi:parvulin-like peptidyl-prolyl isomerase
VSEIAEFTALQVNGEEISLGSLLRQAKFAGRLEWVQAAVDAALVRQEAAERGITVSAEELQQAADRYRTERSLADSAATHAWLAARHLTVDDWVESLEEELLAAKVRVAVAGGRVEQHFAQHLLTFEWAVISHILVEEEGLAWELMAQIEDDDADFYALARRYSRDAATRHLGGYMGRIRREDLPAALRAAVFGAKPGEAVGPVQTRQGWRLARVEERHPPVLDDAIREQIAAQLWEEWLAARRKNSEIRRPLLEDV